MSAATFSALDPNGTTALAFNASDSATTLGVPTHAATTTVSAVATPPTGTRVTAGPLAAGQSFGPRYHIIRVLGAGGMGVVYQAWDAELGVAVALKVIRPEVLMDPGSAGEVEKRFKRELVLARQVTHKHVVRIHDLGELDGIKYLTMPFVEGENLANVLKREGSLPVDRALAIAKQVASGLAAAHEVGVVHRDLKPENVMIAADGGALIMDFGISRSVGGTGTATALGAVMGTLEYMAPEQAQGQAVDHRADIYSFGLLLYDMLTGRQRIARRDNPMSEMMSRMTQAPPAVRTLDASLPETVEKIVSKCLQPSAAARYATTPELVADLESLTPDGHKLTPVRAGASRRLVLALSAALVVVLVAGGWWAWRTRGRGVPPAAQEPVSVLIANFDNSANEPLLDGLVEQALGVGIEGASFVSTYPRKDAVRLISQIKGPGAALTEGNARLVAQREGIKRVIAGSISLSGSKYDLSVKILDTEGKVAMLWDTEASGKEDVLAAVGRLAAKVRNALGDATANADQVKGAETFTAASLEAAHEYVRGQELQGAGDYKGALSAYQKAVQLDPQLGRAYAGMGAVSSSLLNTSDAVNYYKQALGLIDRMTDREKYRTRSGYYLLTHDLDKAVEQLEGLVKQFPADSTALSNLAVAHAQRRDLKRALDFGRRASAIYPNHVLRRNNVALIEMYAGDFAAAEQHANGVLELNKNFAKAYLAIALSQLGSGRPAEAEATWLRLKDVPTGHELAAFGRADLAMYEGRLSDAASILEAETANPPAGRSTTITARLVATLAEVRLLQGRNADAIKLADEALGKGEHNSAFMAGRVLIEAGKPSGALELAEDLDKKLDREPHMYASLLRGEVDLKRGDVRGAVENFTAAQKIIDSWIGHYGLGRAYLSAGDATNAQTEFDACASRKGEATNILLDDIPTYRFMAALRYYIGRAQEGQGSPAAAAAAQESYKTFLAVKQKGDEEGLVSDARRRVKP